MKVLSLKDLGVFPSVNEEDICFDVIKTQETFETHKKKDKPKRIRAKKILPEIIPEEKEEPGTILSVQEQKFIHRINSSLERNSKTSRNFAHTVGRIKGICHNKNIDPYNIILYLESIGIAWNKFRDSHKMTEYRKEYPICENCLTRQSVHTHHIIPVSLGGKETKENYIALCLECHIEKHPELPKGFLC